jgi:hypothetical protein
MREKSSSVFTSFNRRSALRWTVANASPASARSGDASASCVGPSSSVSGVRLQRLHRQRARILGGACGRIARGEVPQQREPALANDALGRFGDDAVQAANGAGFVAHRIVGDVEVGVLDEAVALEREQQIPGPEGLAGAHHTLEQRAQLLLPDLAPRDPRRQPERVRMLGAEDGTIGVVVETDELRSPEQNDLRLRRQQHADGAAQALRPGLDGAEGRTRPVEGAHPLPHLAAPGQERQLAHRSARLRHVADGPSGGV